MILYFIFGLLFLMTLDFSLQQRASADEQFTNLERTFILIMWPIFLIILIIKHIKHNQNEDK